MKVPHKSFGLIIFALIIAGCAPSNNAAQVVEQYIRAKVAGDQGTIRALLCANMEAELEREATSFANVEARVEGMTCAYDENQDTVTCSGAITAIYGGEDTVFPLSTYRVVQEDGAWKWCGEAD